MKKEFNFRKELNKIVQYAELDDVRWKSLMNQVDDKFEEFIKLLKDWVIHHHFEVDDFIEGSILTKIDKLAGEKFI